MYMNVYAYTNTYSWFLAEWISVESGIPGRQIVNATFLLIQNSFL